MTLRPLHGHRPIGVRRKTIVAIGLAQNIVIWHVGFFRILAQHPFMLAPLMIQLEVLEESVSWPFTIPPGRSNHDGVPSNVTKLSVNAKPWHLIGWKDSSSNSIGIARNHQAISINTENLDGLSICFMRKAKGAGFVSFEATILGNRNKVVFFEVDHFNEDALLWLQSKANKLETLFGVQIAVNDYGFDY
ncbi:hypothetical protein H3H36_09330 [Duganella sp. FT3S]|uniref:Uncharacterized protein n=1 Tax=Rugamonas fusca TaxID=2758568 RepID=A0A7W2EGR3_9BURK|nr:hypothetical protein [Rugamonas fusca]MBA5605561.1 hypothetical protein [Rugamonas fusca]